MIGTTFVVSYGSGKIGDAALSVFYVLLNLGIILRNSLSLEEDFRFFLLGDAALLRKALMNVATLTSFYGSGQVYNTVLITVRYFFSGDDSSFD